MKFTVSTARVASLVTHPLVTLGYRALVTIATVSIAVAAWWMKSYATLPEKVTASEQRIEAHAVEITATRSELGKLSDGAKEAARVIASLQQADEQIRAEVRATQTAQAALDKSLALTQAQGAETLRRLDSLDRKLEKIGDRLGVP